MPYAPPKPCAHPRCPALAESGRRWCAAHRPAAREEQARANAAIDRRRGSAAERGYGAKWAAQSAAFRRRHPLCYGWLVPTAAWSEPRARELHALREAACEAGALADFHAPSGTLGRWLEQHRIYTWRPLVVPKLSAAVDHIVPHKGSRHLFWSEWNWQALDERSHNRKTAMHDRGSWSCAPRAAESMEGGC